MEKGNPPSHTQPPSPTPIFSHPPFFFSFPGTGDCHVDLALGMFAYIRTPLYVRYDGGLEGEAADGGVAEGAGRVFIFRVSIT